MCRKSDHTASTLRICIDDIQSAGELKGRICGIAVKESAVFSGSSDLFILIDHLLDAIGRPQPTRKTRSFRDTCEKSVTCYCGEPILYHDYEEICQQKGKFMTRDVCFISRLRSSWQGVMKDIEGNVIGNFDSDLEFIDLLYDRGVTD